MAESYEAGETRERRRAPLRFVSAATVCLASGGAPSGCGDDDIGILVCAGCRCSADAGAGGEASDAARRQKAARDAGVIELEIDGIAMRVGRGADARTVAAVIRALKATS